jgi:hypothetical protein
MKYQKTQANGESFSQLGNSGDGVTVEVLTGAATLTGADSGKHFIMKAAAGAAIVLPAVAMAGWCARFTVGQKFATSAWTITAATKVIQGAVIVNSTHVAGENEDIITFAHAADNVGDFVEIFSDGTNWNVFGSGVAAGAITLTASA